MFKQEPKTVEISTDKKGLGINNERFEKGIKKAELDGNTKAVEYLKEQYSNFKKGNGFSWDLVNNKGIAGKYMQDESISNQHSIDITPELKTEVGKGLPLFGGLNKIGENTLGSAIASAKALDQAFKAGIDLSESVEDNIQEMEDKGIIEKDCK